MQMEKCFLYLTFSPHSRWTIFQQKCKTN